LHKSQWGNAADSNTSILTRQYSLRRDKPRSASCTANGTAETVPQTTLHFTM